jgi:hypothetical protein
MGDRGRETFELFFPAPANFTFVFIDRHIDLTIFALGIL